MQQSDNETVCICNYFVHKNSKILAYLQALMPCWQHTYAQNKNPLTILLFYLLLGIFYSVTLYVCVGYEPRSAALDSRFHPIWRICKLFWGFALNSHFYCLGNASTFHFLYTRLCPPHLSLSYFFIRISAFICGFCVVWQSIRGSDIFFAVCIFGVCKTKICRSRLLGWGSNPQ